MDKAPTKIVLCSQSILKTEAVEMFVSEYFDNDVEINNYDCGYLQLPEQPLKCEAACARERLFGYLSSVNSTTTTKDTDTKDTDTKDTDTKDTDGVMIISIENGLSIKTNPCKNSEVGKLYDNCCVVVWYKGTLTSSTYTLNVPEIYTSLINDLGPVGFSGKGVGIKGYDTTLGTLVNKQDPSKNPKNWNTFDRRTVIDECLKDIFMLIPHKLTRINTLNSLYKSYPDFPKPGVVFEDLFAVMSDSNGLKLLCEVLSDRYSYLKNKLDYVVGLESRGFFGVLLARELGCGFVPIRKAGKLPGELESIEYGTEYSTDKCEISKDLPKGSKVIIFDDLVATGGSLKAAVDLVLKVGSVVVDCCVLREVVGLRKKAVETLQRSYTVLL